MLSLQPRILCFSRGLIFSESPLVWFRLYSGFGPRACDVPQHGELIGFLSAMRGRIFHSYNFSRYLAPSSFTVFVSHSHVFTFCLHLLTMVDRQTRSVQHQRNIFFQALFFPVFADVSAELFLLFLVLFDVSFALFFFLFDLIDLVCELAFEFFSSVPFLLSFS